MTDRADEIAAKFQDIAAPKIAAVFHPDRFEVWRSARVHDTAGGYTSTQVKVDEGRCSLDVDTARSGESLQTDVAIAASSYTCELPYTVNLTTDDELRIVGVTPIRIFAVLDVKRGGDADLFTVARLEERS